MIPAIIWSWVSMETTSALYGVYDAGKFARQYFTANCYVRRIAYPNAGNCDRSVGSTLSYRITGLFLGPIVLSIIWERIASRITVGARAVWHNDPYRVLAASPFGSSNIGTVEFVRLSGYSLF
jgi:hypothetical protein